MTVVRFEPGLRPVLKHGQHNQKDHGRGRGATATQPVDADQIAAQFAGPVRGNGVEVTATVTFTGLQPVVRGGPGVPLAGGELVDSHGRVVGEWARAVEGTTLHAVFLTVGTDVGGAPYPGGADVAGKGLALEFQKRTETAARALGCDTIRVHAVDQGAAAWANERFGYRFATRPDLRTDSSPGREPRDDRERAIPLGGMGYPNGSREYRGEDGLMYGFRHPDLGVPAVRARVADIERRLASSDPGDWPSPHEVATVGTGRRVSDDVIRGATLGEWLLSRGWEGVKPSTHVTKAASAVFRLIVDPAVEPVAKHGSHDQSSHGRRGGTATLDHPAVDRLRAGEAVIVKPDAVADVVLAFRDSTDGPIDLTNLHVEGHGLFGSEGLGIPREDMPQIPKAHRDKFFEEMRAKGVTITEEQVSALSLHPTQREMDAVNVAGMVHSMREGTFSHDTHTLIASSDGYILDGHHRWAASAITGLDGGNGSMRVARVGLPIRDLLEQAQAFNEREGIEARGLGDHRRRVYKALCDVADARAVLKHLDHDQSTHGRKGKGSDSTATVNQFTDDKGNLVKPFSLRDPDHPDETVTVIPGGSNPLDGMNVVSIYRGDRQAGVMRYGDDGEVAWVHVEEPYRRQGIATRLWESAKWTSRRHPNMPEPRHSDSQTDEGRAWAAVTKHGSHDQSTHGRRFSTSVDPSVARAAIESTREHGGLSIRLTDGYLPEAGFMVGRDSTRFGIAVSAESFYGPDGARAIADMVKKNRAALGSGRAYLGVWHQKSKWVGEGKDAVEVPLPWDEQVVHLDVSDNIPNRGRAVSLGRRRDQISVWDVVAMEEIQTGGKGGEVAKGTRGVRDPEAPAGDDRRGDRPLGRGRPRGDGRPAVVRFGAGLRPVLKHGDPSRPGYAQQHPDSKAAASSMPDGWAPRSREQRIAEVVERARADFGGAIPEDRLQAFGEAAIEGTVLYDGPNGTTLIARDDIPEPALIPQMRQISHLQSIAPVPGLEVVVSDATFAAYNLPESTLGFVGTGMPNTIHLRRRAVMDGANTRSGRLMPVYTTDSHLYVVTHEYGHVLDRRSKRQSADDHAEAISSHQTGMSRYAFDGDPDDGEGGREAFAEAFVGFVGSRGQLAAPDAQGGKSFVRFYAETYGWDHGDGDRPLTAGFAKAEGPRGSTTILADTFTEEGAIVRIVLGDGLAKHGSHDQSTHGRRGSGGGSMDLLESEHRAISAAMGLDYRPNIGESLLVVRLGRAAGRAQRRLEDLLVRRGLRKAPPRRETLEERLRLQRSYEAMYGPRRRYEGGSDLRPASVRDAAGDWRD